MSAETLSFAQLVKQDQEENAKRRREETNQNLAVACGRYEENKGVAECLKLEALLAEAALSIKEVTGREAVVIKSKKPHLNTDELTPKIPVLKGSSEWKRKLEWEPINTSGVKHAISVCIDDGIISIGSGELNDSTRWHRERINFQDVVEDLSQGKVNTALFEAYKHPYTGDSHWF